MVFPVVGGDGKPTGYEIDNSLRFNDGDTPRLTNDPGGGSGSDGSRTQFSISMWVKRSNLGLGSGSKQDCLISASATNNFYNSIKFNPDDRIQINLVNSGSDQDEVVTDAAFRDVSAWYHLFFVFDKTQAALSNGIKLYVNGVQQTFGTTTYAQNQGYHFSRPGKTTAIGVNQVDTSSPFDGYMAEIHFIDGQLKAHTDFGETNDNGVWIPKKYDGTYGTYGFYLEFKQTGTSENSSGIGADTSGNDEHFAVSNLAAIDVTTDTPTNNFATLNATANFHVGATYQEGGTRFVSDESKYGYAVSTIGVPNGKWYAEFKMISKDGESGNWYMVGVAEGEQRGHRLVLGRDTNYPSANQKGQVGYVGYGTNFIYQNDAYYNNDSNSYSTAAFADGDIIGVALNADDYQVTFYKNGTVQNSGTAFELGNFNVYGNPDLPVGSTGFWHFGCGHFDTGNTFTIDCNFGNAPFSISSGNADANGYGNFEYSVPSGYYALCTKNLAEFG